MARRRAPFIAIKNHWDPRSEEEPWTAYSAEADSALADRLTEEGPGRGFHECVNFEFDNSDNKPDLHLYLPPSCFPSESTTDTADLLVFIFTYAEGGGPIPRHLVAIAGHATLVHTKDEEPRLRKDCGATYGEDLYWSLSADPGAGCVLVEPLDADDLEFDYLDGHHWREGLRYVEPKDAEAVLAAVRDAGQAALDSGEQAKEEAARRQVRVCTALLASYREVLFGKTVKGPESKPKPRKGKSGAGYTPDDAAGLRAEEAVYKLELKKVSKQLKKARLSNDAEELVIWWRAHGRDREHHDIESVRVSKSGEFRKLLLEVKSSRAADFSSVHVSEVQLQCARDAATDGVLHEFVFVRTEADDSVGKTYRLGLAEVEAILAPTQWRVPPGSWTEPP